MGLTRKATAATFAHATRGVIDVLAGRRPAAVANPDWVRAAGSSASARTPSSDRRKALSMRSVADALEPKVIGEACTKSPGKHRPVQIEEVRIA